jgi:hypothetical protein
VCEYAALSNDSINRIVEEYKKSKKSIDIWPKIKYNLFNLFKRKAFEFY